MSADKVRSAVNRMNTEFPRPGICSLCISDPYDLETDWPDQYWPNRDAAGVYLFFDDKDHLVYIGKTVGRLDVRISQYFNHRSDGSARPTCTKSEGVRYVRTISVREGHEFEAAAIESFLIRELSPPRNKRT